MALQDTDIVIYGSDNMREDDVLSPQGGPINTAIKMTFTDITGATNPTAVSVLSNNMSDSGVVLVRGRSLGGSIVEETLNLLGTSSVLGAQTFERILRVHSSGHIGTLTVTAATDSYTLATLESGVSEVRRPFFTVTGDAAGGSDRNYYEKVFIKNNSATNDLLSATVGESSDGTESPGANITFSLETGVNGNVSSTNRVTSPATGSILSGVFSDNTQEVPGGSLPLGSAIGVWLRLNIPAGTAPTNTTFVFDINGATS